LEEIDGDVKEQANPGHLPEGGRRGPGFGECALPESGPTGGKTDGIGNGPDMDGRAGGNGSIRRWKKNISGSR
jgi:hypothetical protein